MQSESAHNIISASKAILALNFVYIMRKLKIFNSTNVLMY